MVEEKTKTVLWIDRFFERGKKMRCGRLLFSFFFVSLPSLLLLTPFYFLRWEVFGRYTFRMWLGLVCGGVWIWICPCLVSGYVASLKRTLRLAEKNRIVKFDTAGIYNGVVEKLNRFGPASAVWIVFILLIVFADVTYLRRFGIGGYGDPILYLFAVVVSYILYYTSLGIIGAVSTFRLIGRLIGKKELSLDYYNPDRMGGLKCLKDFIFTTSKLFATGVLFFPILLDYVAYTNALPVKLLLYCAIVAFSVVLILTFLVPIKRLYTYANRLKEKHLDFLCERFKSLTNDSIGGNSDRSLKDELAAVNLYHLISLVSETTMFRVSSDIWLQIVGAILIPLFTFFLNGKDILAMLGRLLN